MKKFLHRLMSLMLILLPFILGGTFIYVNGFNIAMWNKLSSFIQGSPAYGIVVGLLLILLSLIYLATLGENRSSVRFISFDSDDGAVSVSINAVRDFIRKIGDEFSAVISLEPKIRTEKDLISIHLDVKIQTGTRIPELSQILQQRIRESIRDGLGIAEVREIEVCVQEIIGTPPPSHTA